MSEQVSEQKQSKSDKPTREKYLKECKDRFRNFVEETGGRYLIGYARKRPTVQIVGRDEFTNYYGLVQA